MRKTIFSENQIRIFSHTGAQAWSAFLQLFSIPFYFIILGPESYGLLGIFASIESLVIIIDMTISSTVSRETARKLVIELRGTVKYFILKISKYYIIITIVCSILFFLLIKLLLQKITIDNPFFYSQVINFSIVAALTISLRLGISFTRSILIGDQRQTALSIISIIFVTLRIGGSFVLLYFISNDFLTFLIWNMFSFILELLALSIFVDKIFGESDKSKIFDSNIMGDVVYFAPKMFFLAISSLIITQSDRVLISLKYDLIELGQYNYAKNFVLGMFVLSGGIYAFLYPTISALFVKKDWDKIKKNCELIASILAWSLFPFGIILVFLGENLISIFNVETGFDDYNRKILILLVVGTIINLLWMVPYVLQLASGLLGIPILINAISIPITLLITWVGFGYVDMLSAPIAYLIYNIMMLLFGCLLLDIYLPQIRTSSLMIRSIIVPVFVGALIFYLINYYSSNINIIIHLFIMTFYILFISIYVFKKTKKLSH